MEQVITVEAVDRMFDVVAVEFSGRAGGERDGQISWMTWVNVLRKRQRRTG